MIVQSQANALTLRQSLVHNEDMLRVGEIIER